MSVVQDQESTAVNSTERRQLREQNIPHSTFANNTLFLAINGRVILILRMHENEVWVVSSINAHSCAYEYHY